MNTNIVYNLLFAIIIMALFGVVYQLQHVESRYKVDKEELTKVLNIHQLALKNHVETIKNIVNYLNTKPVKK